MIAFISLILGMAILGAVQQLWQAARRAHARVAARCRSRTSNLVHPFGLPSVAAPKQPQAVRKGGAA